MTSSDSPTHSPSYTQSLHQRKNSTVLETSPEKENQSPKLKRPLPVPKEVQPVPATSFYGTSSKSSKTQVSTAGSSHTIYAESSPPPYHAKETTPYREPELVVEEPVPPLISSESGVTNTSDWPSDNARWPPVTSMPWDNIYSRTGWDSSPSRNIDIDGRSEEEELNWANKELRERCKRPGPGVLPPLLTQLLHNPDHTLYSVTASVPDFTSTARAGSSTMSASSVSPPPTAQSTAPPPSQDEVRTAIPHPNAYYCKEHNGWVLLIWRTSSVLPSIAPSFTPTHPFPDQARRKRTTSCISQDEQSVGQSNKTHHFHKYERAVDARALTTPYKRSDWETEVRQKQRRRKMTLRLDEKGEEIPANATAAEERVEEPEADMLDLYLCCQCSTYCLVSEIIPGVIPLRCLEEFNKDKLEHPRLGKSGELTLITGWETIITILSNKLWKGENRVLPVTRPKFQSKLGWNGAVRRIFEALDFVVDTVISGNATAPEVTVVPPLVDLSTPEGKRSRAKLLRAWVEISAWLTLYHKSRPKDPQFVPSPLGASVESATEMYQTKLGAHVSQIPRGLLPDALIDHHSLDKAWSDLGLTPTSYGPELLMFAYLAQCRCDPANTPSYFSQFYKIVDTMKECGVSPPEQLELLIGEERSRHRFTTSDLEQAMSLLGFGKDGILGVELDEEVDDQFIIYAWKNAQKRAWREPSDKASQLRSDLNDAFRMVAEWKCSDTLRQAWERDKGPIMTEETAYRTLDVPKETDETMLITIFNLRVEDQPLQADKMREALTVIAEVRDNQRLRDFLVTGRDTEDITPENTLDMPRGLNQLGNTCYLNSLLQYFYTIRDLRSTISALPQSGSKFLDDSKFTDDDLRRHRVGGRLVTRREVQRSKRFVHQLADLFWNLEFCDTAAVTPTKELAKLALITSQDEEEDDQGSAGTDTSNDTDATLVDDGPVRSTTLERSAQSPVSSASPVSVLGKRGRELPHMHRMDVDGEAADVDKDGYVMVSKPSSPGGQAPENIASSSKQKNVDHGIEDVEMRDETQKPSAESKPPPLPPRRPKEVNESVMMFGRQHDVSECMDNCMFQIETALLDFQDEEMENAESDKTSVIKRLFYGKKRQRLTPLTSTPDKRQRTLSTHEKEDIFSHLHINVSDESFDLYDGLGRYFDDVVELNGVKKRMEVTLVDLPPLLQIQLQRVQFDRDTQQAYKSQAYVKFGESLYMDRFLDSADSEKRVRSKEIQSRLNTVRDRIQRLTQGKHAPFAPALGGVAGFLSKRKVAEIPADGEDLVLRLNAEQSLVISELERLRAEAVRLKQEQESIWETETEAAYELTAVFIHRGSSPSFGHYFLYARNLPHNPDQWFKYNDSSVSVVSKDEVLADTTGSTANPYMLVFSRKDSEIIDTVRRFDPATLEEPAA